MQCVGSPTQLPRTEILLPTLFVEVREDEEQQEGNNARYDDHTGSDVIHGLALTPRFPGGSTELVGDFTKNVVTRHSHRQ